MQKSFDAVPSGQHVEEGVMGSWRPMPWLWPLVSCPTDKRVRINGHRLTALTVLIASFWCRISTRRSVFGGSAAQISDRWRIQVVVYGDISGSSILG